MAPFWSHLQLPMMDARFLRVLGAVGLAGLVAVAPATAVAPGQLPPAAGARPVVYVVPIQGMIDLGLAPFVERVLAEAATTRAAAVILEVNTSVPAPARTPPLATGAGAGPRDTPRGATGMVVTSAAACGRAPSRLGSHREVRRGIVLMTVLGPCRALEPPGA